jgi:hypothetical protein
LQNAVTENQKEQVRGFIRTGSEQPVSIVVLNIGSPHIQISIGQYSFEEVERTERKILQFPARTRFALQIVPQPSDESERVARELTAFLGQHAMRVETGRPQ